VESVTATWRTRMPDCGRVGFTLAEIRGLDGVPDIRCRRRGGGLGDRVPRAPMRERAPRAARLRSMSAGRSSAKRSRLRCCPRLHKTNQPRPIPPEPVVWDIATASSWTWPRSSAVKAPKAPGDRWQPRIVAGVPGSGHLSEHSRVGVG